VTRKEFMNSVTAAAGRANNSGSARRSFPLALVFMG